MFKKLEGDTALLRRAGAYYPVDLYTWQGGLYAKLPGGGYARLREDGTTSRDGVQFVHLETEVLLHRDQFGRLGLEGQGAPVSRTDLLTAIK